MRIPISLLTLFFATAALAQAPTQRGTVNDVSQAQIARARVAITKAGYQPTVFQFAQDGNLFFTAIKDDNSYGITVTPSYQVYASAGLPLRASAP
jgi:hypothetical protein